MQYIKKSGLILAVLVGLFLYLYKLDVVPSGLYVDEAVTGYNAYSILKTGKDEYGKLFPIAFRFFGSYTPGLYTYFSIPFVSFFGLSPFSTRFLSALTGAMEIVVVYYLLQALKLAKSKYAILLGTFLFAISPWNVFYARVGYEVYLAFFIFSLGVFLSWKGLKDSKYLVPSFVLLSLSTHAAHTQKYLVPLFIIGYLTIFKPNKKLTVKGLVAFLIIQIPNLYLLTTPSFYTKGSLFYSDVVLHQADKMSDFLPVIISVPLAFIREFFSQFLTYFSPRSLFILSDSDLQRSIPELGVFYSWMVIPYFVGIYTLWSKRKEKAVKFVVFLALVAPLPTVLVSDPFSSQRALPLLLPLILIISLGIDKIIRNTENIIWIPAFVLLVCVSLLLLWRSYFVLLPKERAKTWGYGFKQLADEIEKRPDRAFVIDQARIKPAYIELAFFLEYPPDKFQEEVDQDIRNNYYHNVSFNQNYSFGNINTRNIDWETDIYKEQILVGDELAISSDQAKEHYLDKTFLIKSPVEEIIFIGYETNPDKKCMDTPDNINCTDI